MLNQVGLEKYQPPEAHTHIQMHKNTQMHKHTNYPAIDCESGGWSIVKIIFSVLTISAVLNIVSFCSFFTIRADMNIIPVTTIGAVDAICAAFSIVPDTSFSISTQS